MICGVRVRSCWRGVAPNRGDDSQKPGAGTDLGLVDRLYGLWRGREGTPGGEEVDFRIGACFDGEFEFQTLRAGLD
jgi:hypothetical protein